MPLRSALSLLAALALSAGAVGGCSGARAANGPSALADFSDSDPASIRAHAERCDQGDMVACNRVGVWFTVGGGGPERKERGLHWFRHACNNRYQPACRMVADLTRN